MLGEKMHLCCEWWQYHCIPLHNCTIKLLWIATQQFSYNLSHSSVKNLSMYTSKCRLFCTIMDKLDLILTKLSRSGTIFHYMWKIQKYFLLQSFLRYFLVTKYKQMSRKYWRVRLGRPFGLFPSSPPQYYFLLQWRTWCVMWLYCIRILWKRSWVLLIRTFLETLCWVHCCSKNKLLAIYLLVII